MLIISLAGCRKAMSPEQLMREASLNLSKSDKLHLHVELTADLQDGTLAEPETLAVMDLYADGLRGNAGRASGAVRFAADGERVNADFYSDGEWLYASVGDEGVRIPIANTGLEGLIAGVRLPTSSELLPEPEVRVEEERTVLIYRLRDGMMNSLFDQITGSGIEALLPNGNPVFGDGEMVIVIFEGEIREITCSMLTVGERPTELKTVISFLETTDMQAPLPPEGYESFPIFSAKETAGAGN